MTRDEHLQAIRTALDAASMDRSLPSEDLLTLFQEIQAEVQGHIDGLKDDIEATEPHWG